MYLKKDHLVIREATINDVSILCKWWNDGSVMAHAGYPNGLGITPEKVANQINYNSITHRRLILEFDHEPIGEMSYRQVADGIVEMGIKICEFNMQEKGYGTNYLKMLITYLFDDLGFEKIILDTNLTNKRAQHVYEKIGFKKIKVNMDSWKDQLGVYQSSVDYELIKDDFNL